MAARVGYAFREKRVKSFFTTALLQKGEEEGIEFVRINTDEPLLDQGRFDILLHKLDGDKWEKELQEYTTKYPDSIIIDKYESVHRLDDRLEMLKAVTQLDPSKLGAAIEVPKQCNIPFGTAPEDIVKIMEENGLRLPCVAKPTAANGTANAHQLSLVITKSALSKLEPPLVLQEFVNHGGVLFKLYVLGDIVMVFKRQSLPDIPSEFVDERSVHFESESRKEPEIEQEVDKSQEDDIPTASEALLQSDSIGSLIKQGSGLVEFNRISNVHLSEDDLSRIKVEEPPPSLMRDLGIELSRLTGLKTFNVDVLRESGNLNRYYVVDINYMPGYERLPNFEPMFVNFLKSLVTESDGGKDNSNVIPLATPYPLYGKKKKWVTVRTVFKFADTLRNSSS